MLHLNAKVQVNYDIINTYQPEKGETKRLSFKSIYSAWLALEPSLYQSHFEATLLTSINYFLEVLTFLCYVFSLIELFQDA